MTCPFKVGDRVHELRFEPSSTSVGGNCVYVAEPDPFKPDATVTALIERGFTYRYDKPVSIGRAQWGTTCEGGECFEAGFYMWRKIT